MTKATKPVKPCAVCGQPTRSEHGVCRRTVECSREQARRRDMARPYTEARRTYHAAYHAAHRSKHNAERSAAYYANRDEINSQRRALYASNPELGRIRGLYQRHGMRPEDWRTLYVAQNGCCYLCGEKLDTEKVNRIHIDHDHRQCPPEKSCTVCRRGLACRGCNRAIGMAEEDPGRLRRMADALEAAQLEVERRREVTAISA